MIHIGIDHHKKWAQVVGIDDAGKTVMERRVLCTRQAWTQFKNDLPSNDVQSVLEAGWNWGKLYDLLEELGLNPVLANALKVRLIASSYIKTDRRDALALAGLLRMGWIPKVHVPSRDIRDKKNLLRQRAWLVRQRTGIKNRIHAILDRNHVELPEATDLFGSRGKTWLKALRLRHPDDLLLAAHQDLLDGLQTKIREMERWIDREFKEHPDIPLLMTFPGIGKLLAALIALEIGGIGRFSSPAKLCAYSGLVNSVHQSADMIRRGHLIPTCNRHLRYAFIEAGWTAARVSPYFSAFYRRVKAKKGAQSAVGAVARRLCVIVYHCLKRRRGYVEKPYEFRPGSLVTSLA